MKNKEYYTPNIEELYVGYRCQITSADEQEDNWIDIICMIENIADIDSSHYIPRTKYLTEEDVILCGWNINTDGAILDNWRLYDKSIGDIVWYMNINIETIPYNIEIEDEYGYVSYKGQCKSINELKVIERLLRMIQ